MQSLIWIYLLRMIKLNMPLHKPRSLVLVCFSWSLFDANFAELSAIPPQKKSYSQVGRWVKWLKWIIVEVSRMSFWSIWVLIKKKRKKSESLVWWTMQSNPLLAGEKKSVPLLWWTKFFAIRNLLKNIFRVFISSFLQLDFFFLRRLFLLLKCCCYPIFLNIQI